jgi:phage terminase large subunit-like protein
MAPKPEDLIRRAQVEIARKSLLGFIRLVAPWFIIEEVQVLMAFHLEKVAFGQIDRLRIHTGPRTGKSMMVSVFFPAWYIGINPHDKIFEAANTADLAHTFGEQVLDIITSDIYRAIFPAFRIKKKSTKRMRFTASSEKQAGEWQGFGMGGRIAGRGFNLGILDDPLTEQEYLSTGIKQKHWNWFQVGFYTRRQPEKNAIIVMATRWAHDDIPGRLQANEKEGGDKYVTFSVPAVVDRQTANLLGLAEALDPMAPKDYYIKPGQYVPGMSFAPRRFPAWRLRRSKGNMSEDHWNALMMQRPTADDGKIIKRSYWKSYTAPRKKNRYGVVWTELPPLLYTLVVADTAQSEKETADPTAIQAWGVIKRTIVHKGVEKVMRVPILLESFQGQLGMPDLKLKVKDFDKRWNPDEIAVENKSSGISLIQELHGQLNGLTAWLPGGKKGTNDKVTRAWRAALVMAEVPVYWDSAIVENGNVIDECAMFPFSKNDDRVDCVTMAIDILRRKFLIDIHGDQLETFEKERAAMRPPSNAGEERRPF